MPQRLIDVPIESLPFVDEHYIDVAATTAETWDALMATLERAGHATSSQTFAKRLGCLSVAVSGAPGEIGSTFPGFMVTRSVRPALLALMGQHRFSRYALIFGIVEKPSGLTLLSAQTRAEFPGARGRVYRDVVIGSRGHVFFTRSMLRRIRRSAERAGVPA